ncbi:HNH endonuclease, partial [Fibrobacter sp.]|uniref:HNH endonuclease n=2 Tax=Fibrobacter TaxID=832 RepID=UPI0026061C79
KVKTKRAGSSSEEPAIFIFGYIFYRTLIISKQIKEIYCMSFEKDFINEQTDFFNYMVDNNLFKNRQTYHDYITRLRYISHFYKLDGTLTFDKISDIANELKQTISERDRYNTLKGVSDIVSGLKRFAEYINSDYKKKIEDSILSENSHINNDRSLDTTEKEAIIKSRVGQGLFRQKLIEYWKGCSVTECQNYSLLMASHIMPWRKANNLQRLDIYNGLLLIPNMDKLFDRGYISFSKTGKIIFSDFLSKEDKRIFNLTPSLRLVHLEESHLPYLQYHREYCLL